MKGFSKKVCINYSSSLRHKIEMACFEAIKHHDVSIFDEDSGEMSDRDAKEVSNDAAIRIMKVIFDYCEGGSIE